MSQFTLVVLPDGRAILTTTRTFDGEGLDLVRERLQQWHDNHRATLIIEDCAVVQVLSLELDVPDVTADLSQPPDIVVP